MPHRRRISSEMLMFDLFGSSPGFSRAFGAGGAGVAAGLAVGAAGAGGGSEAQPAAKAVERRTIAAAYFITSSLKHAPSLGRRLVYLDWLGSRAEERVPAREPATLHKGRLFRSRPHVRSRPKSLNGPVYFALPRR